MFAPDFQAIHGANYPRVAFSWPPRVSAHSQRDSHIPNTLSKVSTPVAKARKIRPLFSYSYRLLFPQLPCFDIHLSCLGGGGVAHRSEFDFASLPDRNPSSMSTYAKRAANPCRMRTYKIIGLKVPCNEHLQKNGGWGAII